MMYLLVIFFTSFVGMLTGLFVNVISNTSLGTGLQVICGITFVASTIMTILMAKNKNKDKE